MHIVSNLCLSEFKYFCLCWIYCWSHWKLQTFSLFIRWRALATCQCLSNSWHGRLERPEPEVCSAGVPWLPPNSGPAVPDGHVAHLPGELDAYLHWFSCNVCWNKKGGSLVFSSKVAGMLSSAKKSWWYDGVRKPVAWRVESSREPMLYLTYHGSGTSELRITSFSTFMHLRNVEGKHRHIYACLLLATS